MTIHDFEELVAREHWVAERSIYLSGNRKVTVLPNLMAETAVFLFRK
jgi:hypothetical protein